MNFKPRKLLKSFHYTKKVKFDQIHAGRKFINRQNDSPTTRMKHGLTLLQTFKFDKKTCSGSKETKCPANKTRIQMQQLFFPGC